MENGQFTGTTDESENQADISDDSTKLPPSDVMESDGSQSSPAPITATIPTASRKIWKKTALLELRSKTGLVAGALADFQDARGQMAIKTIEYRSASGRVCKAQKIVLWAEDLNLVAVNTDDGLDLRLMEAT